MNILVINTGSSSLKFSLYQMPEEKVIITGQFERIGIKESFYKLKYNNKRIEIKSNLENHDQAIAILLRELIDRNIVSSLQEISAIGHRIVHGGEKYNDSVLIDEEVINNIEKNISLAPLHNPTNLLGLNILQKKLPTVPHVAVFDTAFHQTIDKSSFLYPIPYSWYKENRVRKYGFHGTSHKYIAKITSELLERQDLKIISCHLGNGCSITAIKNGHVLDTSMGFTPNAGLMMGTRSGDIDATIIPYIMQTNALTIEEVIEQLNKKSGLLGITEESSDYRDLIEGLARQDERCLLANEMYIKRILSYISYYYVLLNKADVIVFTGGIGENAIDLRKQIIAQLSSLEIYLDEDKNQVQGKIEKISRDNSKTMCYVIPTNEELMIAKDTYRVVQVQNEK